MKHCRACKNCQKLHVFCDLRETNSENLYKDGYYLEFINEDFNILPCTCCKNRGIYCELVLRKKRRKPNSKVILKRKKIKPINSSNNLKNSSNLEKSILNAFKLQESYVPLSSPFKLQESYVPLPPLFKLQESYVPLPPLFKMIQTTKYNEERYLYPETKEVLLTNVEIREMLHFIQENN